MFHFSFPERPCWLTKYFADVPLSIPGMAWLAGRVGCQQCKWRISSIPTGFVIRWRPPVSPFFVCFCFVTCRYILRIPNPSLMTTTASIDGSDKMRGREKLECRYFVNCIKVTTTASPAVPLMPSLPETEEKRWSVVKETLLWRKYLCHEQGLWIRGAKRNKLGNVLGFCTADL